MNEFLIIFENYYFRMVIVTFISILITNFLKRPIKNKTEFLNESTRKIVNMVILIIILQRYIYMMKNKKNWTGVHLLILKVAIHIIKKKLVSF